MVIDGCHGSQRKIAENQRMNHSGVIKQEGRKEKGCDFGYALAADSSEGVLQRGCMYRHSP